MTAVPRPTFGDRGFVAPSEADILAGVQADINIAMGGNLNPGLSTPQGQIASSEAAIIGDKNASFIWYTNQIDPALNSGRMQDAIGRIYFMQRIAGAPTVVQATCSGLTGVVIPVGAIARAEDGNLYICHEIGTILDSGSVVLEFACAVDGPVVCATGALNQVYQSIAGWDSITNLGDGILGRYVETPAEFEDRRARSVAINAIGILDAIQGAVLAVPGVLDAFVVDNVENTPTVIGGKTLGPNSIYVAVTGGDSQAIAEAIWSRKAPGCGYNGNTVRTVVDPSPDYLPPPPSYFVRFERPQIKNFAVLVILKNNAGVPANVRSLIQAVVVAAFAGQDGRPRAKIGSTVFASRLYTGVALLGSWVQIVSIRVGFSGAAASFTGSVSGTTLTVSAIASGTLAVGQLVQDAGLLNTGTTIAALGTGTGGTGTYTLFDTQTISSEAMTATNLANDLSLDIDEAPAIAPENIHVTFE